MSYLEVSPSIRPYLSVIKGKLMVEPLEGLAFPLGVGRQELQNFLKIAAASTSLDVGVSLEEEVTVFNIEEGGLHSLLVYDNEMDQLITIVTSNEERVLN